TRRHTSWTGDWSSDVCSADLSLVFVGGSLVSRGSQNILEPAGQRRLVLFGPNMMNFRESVEVLLGRGGIQVQSPAQLEKVAKEQIGRASCRPTVELSDSEGSA